MIPKKKIDRFQVVPPDVDFTSLRRCLGVEGGKLLVSVLRQMLDGTVRIFVSHIVIPTTDDLPYLHRLVQYLSRHFLLMSVMLHV